jgi:hypothetical protein
MCVFMAFVSVWVALWFDDNVAQIPAPAAWRDVLRVVHAVFQHRYAQRELCSRIERARAFDARLDGDGNRFQGHGRSLDTNMTAH